MKGSVGKHVGAALIAASALALAPLSAQAGPYNGGWQCPNLSFKGNGVDIPLTSTYLNAVYYALAAPNNFKNSRDQANLLAKDDEAWAKSELKKWADAHQKLQNIEDTVYALVTAAKPKLKDATAINAAVNDAQLCLQAP
jgi:hypothetical protein